MAVKTQAKFVEQSLAMAGSLDQLENLWLERLRSIVNHHNALGFSDAGDVTKPGYIDEDADGNIQGLTFTRQDYISGIVLLNQLENFFTNVAVVQGAYRDTLSVITSP